MVVAISLWWPQCCTAGPLEVGYTRALVEEALLEDALRSLRAAALYAETAGQEAGQARAALSQCEEELSDITAALQADSERPDLSGMDLGLLSTRAGQARERAVAAVDSLRRASGLDAGKFRRPAFAPLPPLSDATSVLDRFVFAALAPTQAWPGWQLGAEAWEVLRALDLQAVSPWFGWYRKPGEPGALAQDAGQIEAMLSRLEVAGLRALLWLEPQYNVDHLWAEIGEELYLHDAQGEWRARTRINNTINVFHPRVREEVCTWLGAVARSQRGDRRIVAYELVEEPALRFDISDPNSADHQPRLGGYSRAARAAFCQRLRDRYGTVTALNRAWGSDYGAFASIEPPAALTRTSGAWEGPEGPLLAEFQEFRAAEHAEYFRQLVAALHAANPGTPVLPQFVTPLFGDPLGGVDLFRMSEVGWDAITFHTDASLAYVYSIARYARRPIWNDEYIWSARAPREKNGERRLRTIAAIDLWRNLAWGARGLVLFNLDFAWDHAKDGGDWNNDLLNEHLGDLAPRYAAGVFPQVLRKVPSFFKELYGSEVVDEGLMILEPTTSVYAAVPTGASQWWATRIVSELQKASFRPAFCPERYLTEGREDLSAYRVLVAPVAPYMPKEVLRRVMEWARRGGVLIAVGPFATHDNFGKPLLRRDAAGEVAAQGTTRAGSGRIVSIPLGRAPEQVVADVREAVEAAIGEREAVASDAGVELILRRLADGGRLLIALNTDPDRRIQGEVTVAGAWTEVADLTVEHGFRVPIGNAKRAAHIALNLDPGEARVFLMRGSPTR